jgi:hypothetical protein
MEPLFDTVVAAEADAISLTAWAFMLLGGALGMFGLAGMGVIAALPARRRGR